MVTKQERATITILGGVGLGICSACRAPGAFWYQPIIAGWSGVWMCDSCQWPEVACARIRAHLQHIRKAIPMKPVRLR